MFLLLVLWACPLSARNDEPQKPVKQVRSIAFEGVKAFPVSELKRILSTKERRFRWFTKAPLDEHVLKEDLVRIEKYYISQGFYHMRLESYDIQPQVGNDVRITIRVEEGPAMILTELMLTVDGEPAGPWHDEITKFFPLKTGARFSTPSYKDIEKFALRYLSDWGYPKAKVDMRARLDKRVNQASVFVDVVRGPMCMFGVIKTEGNETVEDYVILREVAFRPGERFNGSRLQETQQRLFALDLFQFVDISVEELETDNTVLPVRILVKESKKQTIRVGVGYGTEDQFRGRVQYEMRNFMGDGRRLQINAKASSIIQLLEGRLIQPYFLDPKGNLTIDAGILHESQESFENRKVYIRPVYNHKWTDNLRSYVGYDLEANKLLSIDLEIAAQLPADRSQQFFVGSLIGGNVWEKVDSPLDPHDGWRILQDMEWASIGFGSEVDYFKLSIEGRKYTPLPFGVLASRLKWGAMEPLENTLDIPIFKRFFSGGSESVRGYPYQRLGPLDQFGNPIGGLSLLEGSMEWRFPVRKPFEGVLFFDFGNVASNLESFSWTETRYSVGAGVRYMTLLGPLRLDVGYELNPPKQDFFSPYQIHFSIGQAF